MTIRPCESLDFLQLRELFEKQGFAYNLPERGEFVASQVVEENGKIVMAIMARPTVELFFLADKGWKTPAWRWEMFRKLHESMRLELRGKGFTDAHAWLPPEIAKSFGRRLMRNLGWVKQLWPCFSRQTAPMELRKAG